MKNVLATLCAALAAGLLTSGTCSISACNDNNCDPCTTQCVCSQVCHQTPAFIETHKLVVFDYLEHHEASGAWVRTFAHVAGLSTQAAYGTLHPNAAVYEQFSRGILEVNAELFVSHPHGWNLIALDILDAVAIVQLARDPAEVANSVSLLFDRNGLLIEVQQVIGP
jgi:hypothetical protein